MEYNMKLLRLIGLNNWKMKEDIRKLKVEDERVESFHNGWIDGREDLREQIIKLIMKDYTKHPDCCDYINDLLNKINKI